MKNILLKVPAFYDIDYVDELKRINDMSAKDTYVVETYGSLPFLSASQTRINELLSQTNMDSFGTYIDATKSAGIEFEYIMNGTCYGDRTREQLYEEYYKEISFIESLGIQRITASTPYLIEFIHKNFPAIRITASINLCTNSVAQAKRWVDLGVKKIVLDRSINRNAVLLQNILSTCDAEIELLVNSMCLNYCGMHQYHNNINSHICENSDRNFCYNYPYITCFKTYLTNPIEMICSGWIRPEDLSRYKELGIRNFKLEGRGEDKELVLSIIRAYVKNEYNGNIFDLLFTGYKTKKRVGAYLNNEKLAGLFDAVVLNGLDCSHCGGRNDYCRQLASKISFDEEQLNEMLKYIDSLNDSIFSDKPFPDYKRKYIIS